MKEFKTHELSVQDKLTSSQDFCKEVIASLQTEPLVTEINGKRTEMGITLDRRDPTMAGALHGAGYSIDQADPLMEGMPQATI